MPDQERERVVGRPVTAGSRRGRGKEGAGRPGHFGGRKIGRGASGGGSGRAGFSRSRARVGRGAERWLVRICGVRDAAGPQLRGGSSAVRLFRGYGADVQHLPDRGARSDGVVPVFEAVSGRAMLDPLTISRTGGRCVPGGSDLRESRAQSLVSDPMGDCKESKARSSQPVPDFGGRESSRFLWLETLAKPGNGINDAAGRGLPQRFQGCAGQSVHLFSKEL